MALGKLAKKGQLGAAGRGCRFELYVLVYIQPLQRAIAEDEGEKGELCIFILGRASGSAFMQQ